MQWCLDRWYSSKAIAGEMLSHYSINFEGESPTPRVAFLIEDPTTHQWGILYYGVPLYDWHAHYESNAHT